MQPQCIAFILARSKDVTFKEHVRLAQELEQLLTDVDKVQGRGNKETARAFGRRLVDKMQAELERWIGLSRGPVGYGRTVACARGRWGLPRGRGTVRKRLIVERGQMWSRFLADYSLTIWYMLVFTGLFSPPEALRFRIIVSPSLSEDLLRIEFTWAPHSVIRPRSHLAM